MFPRSELRIMDDDPVLFDGPPEWLVSGLRSAMYEAEHDGLGLRSLIERAEVQLWPVSRYSQPSRCVASARVKRSQVRSTV
jgi:hypothetical protein